MPDSRAVCERTDKLQWLLIALAALTCCTAHAVDPRFGELPANPVSTSETRGVIAEICREHVFEPAAAQLTLPKGYRFVLVAEAAPTNPQLAMLLRSRPDHGQYAIGSLCFLAFDTMRVNEASVHSGSYLPTAFWWASVIGPRHADMRGKTDWVQIGSWYSAKAQNRAEIRQADPMAEFVDVEMNQFETDAWRVRLVLPAEVVSAEVRVSGPRKLSKAAQPGYMTVAMSSASANYFSVFTYFGHQHRSAVGIWRATGRGLFSRAFSSQDDSPAFGTVFQEGWSSRSGLYRFTAP